MDREIAPKGRDAIRTAALDPEVVDTRTSLARFTSDIFAEVGSGLHLLGHMLGSDRKSGASPFGHGDDAAVAVSMLLRIGAQLLSGAADLTQSGRRYYGAAALIRQLVEVEYLAWAFETDDDEARKWLRSTREERLRFFTPAKLRQAAKKRFRGEDYSYHCELGGNPVPGSWLLLTDDGAMAQLMLSDGLGHSGRIWDHVYRWALRSRVGLPVLDHAEEMSRRYGDWKAADLLTRLPPPS